MLVVARNVQSALGVIDLIAVQGRTVVFVEVKTRHSLASGHPLEAVTVAKQRQLTRLALAYLRRHRLTDCAARFDVVGIVLPAGVEPEIHHVVNAFSPSEPFQMFS
jgi:putative endonuclease